MKKVLVVEDDPAIQRALKRLFEAEDFINRTARFHQFDGYRHQVD